MRKKEFIRLETTASCLMRGVKDTAIDNSYIERPEDESEPDDTD